MFPVGIHAKVRCKKSNLRSQKANLVVMPLKSSVSQPKAYVHAIADQKNRGRSQHEPISRSNTPSRASDELRPRSGSTTSNNSDFVSQVGDKQVYDTSRQSRQSALALKIELPKGSELQSGITAQRSSFAGHQIHHPQNQYHRQSVLVRAIKPVRFVTDEP